MNPFDILLPIWTPTLELIMSGLRELAILTGSGGLAIILFTMFLKLVLMPLSLMQTKSMKAMQAMQPELAELRKKHGKDREKMAQDQMRLYKEHGVNPAAGCLPMLPMMFILIGLYQALIGLSCNPDNPVNCDPSHADPHFRESWLWIANLSLPDIPFHLPGDIPVPGVLPIVMLITQFIYGKMTPASGDPNDPQQQMMQRMTTYFMPVMLFFFSFNFPAGLVLYWVVSNVSEILRMGFTVSWDPLRPSVLLAGMPTSLNLFGGSGGTARTTTERKSPSSSNGVNPPPNRPPGGTRGKKGKRRGKR